MKKFFAVLLVALMSLTLLVGCTKPADKPADPTEAPKATDAPEVTEAPATEAPEVTEEPTAEPAADNTLNLMDMYTLTDPEGVEYDTRTALYMPFIEGNDEYASGQRHSFCVIYAKDGQGVYMYNVTIFDTEENAAAYGAQVPEAEIDGTAAIETSDAAFFQAMSAFIPDAQTWVDNLMASGYMELD